jgi:hypothetical protein
MSIIFVLDLIYKEMEQGMCCLFSRLLNLLTETRTTQKKKKKQQLMHTDQHSAALTAVGLNLATINAGGKATEEQCKQLLETDAASASECVVSYLGATTANTLSSAARSALVDMAYKYCLISLLCCH